MQGEEGGGGREVKRKPAIISFPPINATEPKIRPVAPLTSICGVRPSSWYSTSENSKT